MAHGEDLHGASFDGFTVEIDAEQQRGDIILDRGEMNTISMGQREELRAAFENLDLDERVRVIVLRATGPNFSSGGFIRGFMEASPDHVSKLADNIAAPARCEKPTIAANRGYCFGVGFEISLACDFRIASETALYALPEQRLGQIPGSGGSARLQKMIGITRTKHIVMRSKRIGGSQAYEWGIVTEVVPDEELEAATDALVAELCQVRPARAAYGQAPAQRDRRHLPVPGHPAGGTLLLAGFASRMISKRAWRPFTRSANRTSGGVERVSDNSFSQTSPASKFAVSLHWGC